MKNATRTKRNDLTINDILKRAALKKFKASLNLTGKFKQAMAMFFIYTLVFVPLLTSETAVQKVSAQITFACSSEPSADFIFQRCAFGAYGKTLEDQAVGDVIQFYNLPDTDAERARVMGFARNEVRGFLFTRMLALLKKPNPTSAEQAGINEFLRRMKQRRVLAAQKALEEYNKWNQTACSGYAPPAPYTYERPAACYGIGGYFSSVKPPSFEEFQQFGSVIAYADFTTPQAQDVATQTTLSIGVGVGAGLAVVGGVVGAAIGATITFSTLSALLPFAAVSHTVLTASGALFIGAETAAFAASTSSGAVGAIALAGPAAIIILALTAAVTEGISVGNASALPGKLQEALDNANNNNFNQFSFTYDDISLQQIYGEFLVATLPDFPGSGVPAATANDRQFSYHLTGSTTYNASPTIEYLDWDGICHQARLSGGWFVDKNTVTNVEKQTLSIRYIDWNNKLRIASRSGAQFVLTDASDINGSKRVDELEFKSCGGTYRGAKIRFEQIALILNPQISFNCRVDNQDGSQNVTLGKVTGADDAPSSLNVTVNNGTSATVNGITLSNLSINGNYEIIARVLSANNVPIPSPATNFTIRVSNGGSSATGTVSLKKSAINDTFTTVTNADVNVGDVFSKQIDFQLNFGQCFSSTNTISGEIPPGITFNTDPGYPNIYVSGRPTTGGKYTFAVQKTYTNGESFSRTYTINVKSDLTKLADGAISWWRAENNADDFNNAHSGTMRGAAGFTDGRVERGFSFDGANGYVELPGNTFDPSRSFTFETWFKTSNASGTILGYQENGVQPYNAPNGTASDAIFVDNAGNLMARMFGGASGAKVFATNVNDGKYHHIAVQSFVAANGQTQRYLYFDGVSKAIYDDPQQLVFNPRYQFGTGYHTATSQNDGATGWRNFKGIIDEPSLYNRVLTGDEIASIYKSGAAGKIAAEVATTPTLDRTGTIRITVRGGARGLQYSIDNGATFKTTSEFLDLTPQTYNVVVKDGAGRLFRTTATVAYAAPGFNVTAQGVNPKCSGATNGTITINPGVSAVSGTSINNGGTVQLLYSLNGGATTQTSNVFTNLAPGNYTPWVKHAASNTVGTGARVTLINPPPLALNPTNFVNSAAVGFSYNQEFQVVNGTTPINVTVSQPPPGLTAYIDNEGKSGAFAIRGTPTQTGTFSITVTATDGNSCPLTQTLSLTVYDNNCRVVTVQNNNDSGAGSLRQTIADACPEARVRIPGSIGQITLNSQILIDKTLNIEADNPNLNVISGNNSTRIFETAVGTTINISGVTLTGGNAGNGAAGGAIANRGTLGIFNSVLVGNRAFSGGAIYNVGALYLSSTSVINNFASGNSVGIFNLNGQTLELRNVTVAGNSTNGAGGGIFNGGTLFIGNSTITGNRSDADGITDGNGTGGGGLAATGTETLVNSIIAGNLNGTTAASTASDISGAIENADYNLIGNAATSAGITNGASGNLVGNSGAGTIPIVSILNPNLALNGGSTPNFALAANSPAIDKGKAYNDFTRFGNSDQRFRTRPVDDPNITNAAGGNGSDIGSFEVQTATPPANSMSISGRITNGGQGLSNVLVLLSNSKTATTYTDADGNYTFSDLPSGGFFDITPTLNGYTFSSPALAYSNVTANVTGADFVTTATSYEGDIAARPTGNGAVDVFDLVSLGRIIGNLDAQPANGGEFQRADVAPLSSLGDGAINVQDLVALGGYVGGLNNKTPASGAASPAAQSFAAQSSAVQSSKLLSEGMSEVTAESLLSQNLFDNQRSGKSSDAPQSVAGTATLGAGSVAATSTNAVVPITLNSMGDVAAIQFTVTYDPSKLSIPMNPTNTAIINRYPNTTFVINNNTPGKLGIVAYQPLDGASVFPAGDIKLFDINFTVANGASGTTQVGFGNDPVPQVASNPQAGAVQTNSAPGTVTLMSPTAAAVSVSGRVLTPEGRGLRGARVSLTDQNGSTRTALTTTFGYYGFTEVAAGETYIISVVSKKYSFTPQVINVNEDMDNLNFTASPKNKTETLSP